MPALLTLIFRTTTEDRESLQEAADGMVQRAQEGIELEEAFSEEDSGIEVLGSTWILYEEV